MNSSLITPSSIQLHLRTLDLDGAAAVELDPAVTLQRQRPGGLEVHVALRFDQHLPLAFDVDLGAGFVERDLDLAVARYVCDARLALVLEEHELVALARDEAVALYLALVEASIAQVRLVLAVPQTSDDKRPANVALLEGNKYLVAHFRDEDRARVGSRSEHRDAGPVGFVAVRQPRELDLDATQLLRVVVLGDDADDHPVNR